MWCVSCVWCWCCGSVICWTLIVVARYCGGVSFWCVCVGCRCVAFVDVRLLFCVFVFFAVRCSLLVAACWCLLFGWLLIAVMCVVYCMVVCVVCGCLLFGVVPRVVVLLCDGCFCRALLSAVRFRCSACVVCWLSVVVFVVCCLLCVVLDCCLLLRVARCLLLFVLVYCCWLMSLVAVVVCYGWSLLFVVVCCCLSLLFGACWFMFAAVRFVVCCNSILKPSFFVVVWCSLSVDRCASRLAFCV